MRSIFILIFSMILFAGCKQNTSKLPEQIDTIVYEGCEYLILKQYGGGYSGYGFMAHKGNCTNPIHCKQ